MIHTMKVVLPAPLLVFALATSIGMTSRAAVSPGEPPSYDAVENVSEYVDAPWFSETSIASRSGANRIGPTERHITNPEGLDLVLDTPGDDTGEGEDALAGAEPIAKFGEMVPLKSSSTERENDGAPVFRVVFFLFEPQQGAPGTFEGRARSRHRPGLARSPDMFTPVMIPVTAGKKRANIVKKFSPPRYPGPQSAARLAAVASGMAPAKKETSESSRITRIPYCFEEPVSIPGMGYNGRVALERKLPVACRTQASDNREWEKRITGLPSHAGDLLLPH